MIAHLPVEHPEFRTDSGTLQVLCAVFLVHSQWPFRILEGLLESCRGFVQPSALGHSISDSAGTLSQARLVWLQLSHFKTQVFLGRFLRVCKLAAIQLNFG